MFKENDNLDKNNDFFRETVINPNDKKAEESADSLDANAPLKDESPSKEEPPKQETETTYDSVVSDSLIFSRDIEYDNPYIKETLLKRAQKRKAFFKYATVAVCGMVVGALIFGGGLLIGKNAKPSGSAIHQYSAGDHTGITDEGTGSLSITEISAKVSPSVVGIVNTQSVMTWFGATEQDGSGSGIIISEDGYILTNNHVIDNASQLKVVLGTGDEYEAVVVGKDVKTDLAILKINATSLPAAELGKSSELAVGDLAVAIGNPLGLEFYGSVTSGIISALNRTMNVEGREYTLIQTDAAINPGNSGGPLVNKYGQVVGINTVKISSSTAEGMGFAIPIDVAAPIVNDLINSGYVTGRPLIGIASRDISENMAAYYGMPVGIYVVSVEDGTGAEAAGIKQGDIIIEADGERVKTYYELNDVKDRFKAGDNITLKIIRSGQEITVNVTLGEDRSQD